jgi:hypothetical protein
MFYLFEILGVFLQNTIIFGGFRASSWGILKISSGNTGCSARLPRLIRVEASNTAGRVHQLQAFFLFLRGRHYTFVYLAA